MQKYVNLVKSFLTSVYLQTLASTQPRTSTRKLRKLFKFHNFSSLQRFNFTDWSPPPRYPHRTQRGTTWIFDRKKIAVHYLRGWFLIDFASVMPFDRLGAMMMSDDADSLDRSKFGDQRKPIFCRWFPPET